MVPTLAISALGAWFHNVAEGIPTQSVETVIVLLPALIIVGWWLRGGNRMRWWVTLVWVGGFNLVGGAALSVLPIPVWPFVPDQSPGHYLAHVVYGVAQAPSLYLLWRTRSEPGVVLSVD